MLDIFVFPIIDWEFRFQRPQQIASRLAKKGHRIFYFRTTFNTFSGELSNDHISIEKLQENIFIIKLATRDRINIYRDLVHGIPQMEEILEGIALVRKKFAIRHSVSIIDHPFWWPVALNLKNNLNVYDCMDDHSGFDNNLNIQVYEPALFAEADLVVVSSDILHQKVSGLNDQVIQVKNGTDFSHFSELPDSEALNEVGKPIVGYYGAIAEWFDVNLMETCAKEYPDYQFVLIGRITNKEISRLEKLSNVHLPGEIPYNDLPQYLKKFDVCLIPFVLTKLIEATNPVKFYEYISSGKPVVSVSLPELEPFRELCYLSKDHQEFIANIQLALDEKNHRDKRIAVARDNSWHIRVDAFLSAVYKLYPRVSIIIVTYNNLPYTQACFESIIKYSRYPDVEIIFIDNGSEDGTPAYLNRIEGKYPDVRTIMNHDNRGFAAANNQGIETATGEYIVFLNNDTVVTNNWIESLVRHLTSDKSIGLMCPATNEAGNEACIRKDYEHIDGLQRFAFNYTHDHSGDIIDIRSVPLFCAMIKTDLIRQIGGLNEAYSIGMFEDDELSENVKKLGYRTVCAKDVFINHFGRASFKKIPKPQYDELFRRNKAIFEKKWGHYVPHIRGWFNTAIDLPEK